MLNFKVCNGIIEIKWHLLKVDGTHSPLYKQCCVQLVSHTWYISRQMLSYILDITEYQVWIMHSVQLHVSKQLTLTTSMLSMLHCRSSRVVLHHALYSWKRVTSFTTKGLVVTHDTSAAVVHLLFLLFEYFLY